MVEFQRVLKVAKSQIDCPADIVPNSVGFEGNVVAAVFVMLLTVLGLVLDYWDTGEMVFDKDLNLDYNPADMDSVD